jgi:hypothetical protein
MNRESCCLGGKKQGRFRDDTASLAMPECFGAPGRWNRTCQDTRNRAILNFDSVIGRLVSEGIAGAEQTCREMLGKWASQPAQR